MSQLNSDVSSDTARALHRVVRAMHDGNCPECGHLGPADAFHGYCRLEPDENDKEIAVIEKHVCPVCGFTITAEEAQAALAKFQEYMAANCRVFKQWREVWRAGRQDAAKHDIAWKQAAVGD